MDSLVAGDHVAAREHALPAGLVGGEAARLAHRPGEVAVAVGAELVEARGQAGGADFAAVRVESMQPAHRRHCLEEGPFRQVRKIADDAHEHLVHVALPQCQAQVMVVDDVEIVAGPENGGHRALLEILAHLA